MQKISIKREQSQAGLSFAEREKFRPQVKNKLLLLLALLMTAATGAWAQTETLLTTITATGTDSYSETTPGVVTVTHDNDDIFDEYGWLWYHAGSITVEAKDGYTITRCVFRQAEKNPVTVSTAPFGVNFIETPNPMDPEETKFLIYGDWSLKMNGVSSIEVYGAVANSIVINGTPQVGDKSISLTYHFDPNNIPGLDGSFAPTLKVKCDADNNWDEISLSSQDVSSGTTNVSLSNLGEFEAGKTYDVCFAYCTESWVDEVFQSFVPAAPAGYTVSLKDGVKDADKWTVKVGEGQAQALPIGGLKGDGSETVTLQYNGRLKVKGVKATSVPDGALSGVFSVSDTKQVNFSKGNLQLVGENTLQFAENQWDYFGINQSDNHRDLLCWGAGNNPNQTTGNSTFTDWGDNTYLQATLGKGWRTMTKDEFGYVFNTRASGSSVFGTANGRYTTATINTDGTGVKGIILFPDGITIAASEVTTAGTINGTSTLTQCTTAQWAALAEKGCVFLPAAGFILSGTGIGHGDIADYWTSTAADASKAYNLGFNFGVPGAVVNTAGTLGYNYGLSVRLVREVATSDEPATGNSVDLSTLTADYEAQDGDVLTGVTSSYKVTIAAGATVTLDGATISGSSYCIKCAGDATIILKDGSTNTLTSTSDEYPALSIGDANTTLTIQGSTGVLNVTSGEYCAGIGGGYKNINSTCGNIRIEGGVITAQGGQSGAGIGTDCGPAICGDIIITGGTINAKGGRDAAGIGTGSGSVNQVVCGDITIANTVTKVTATKGENAPHSIGKGYGDVTTCGTVTIGGTKYWENNAAVNGGNTYLAQSPLIYDPTAQAKPAATVTTAPTGAAIVGAGKSTALVSGGVADGGTLMYAVTTTNTMPTSTAGFSDAVPTAQTITASGTVYVWYFVKADDTHSDSEIAATAIEVPVADIVWDVTNISDIYVDGYGSSYEKEGITLSCNAENAYAYWVDYGDPTMDGIEFDAEQSGGYTFTAPTGKAFTKIEMKAQGSDGWNDSNLGTGWAFNNTTVTWKGSAAASTVELLTDDIFAGATVKSIVFYLSE